MPSLLASEIYPNLFPFLREAQYSNITGNSEEKMIFRGVSSGGMHFVVPS
jgi:hypothetical protein